jgi:hypothetical protein
MERVREETGIERVLDQYEDFLHRLEPGGPATR